MTEGEVVLHVAAYFRSVGAAVIVARPNQARVFFALATGARKAPDIIACHKSVLYVLEAKATASALFAQASSGLSDYECMRMLAESPEMQRDLLARTEGLLRMREEAAWSVASGLAAGSSFTESQLETSAGLVRVEAAPDGTVTCRG